MTLNLANVQKLGQRVGTTLQGPLRRYDGYKEIDPEEILVDKSNRGGAPPHVMYMHCGILAGMKNGFDPTRPKEGICIEYLSPQGLQSLIEHNKRFQGPLMPPIDEKKAKYGSLAGSHLNVSLRIIKVGTPGPSPAGDVRSLMDSCEVLKDVVTKGHRWIVLKECVPPETKVEISLWRNADQNENQGTHEIEILQNVISSAKTLQKDQTKVTSGDLIAKTIKRTTQKIPAGQLRIIADLFMQYLNKDRADLLEEIVEFHCYEVNPRELVVSTEFIKSLNDQSLFNVPLVKMYILFTQYTDEKVRTQLNGPSISQFLDGPSLAALCKKSEVLEDLEKMAEDLRNKAFPILEKGGMQKAMARVQVAHFMDMVIRCLLSKPWSADMPGKLPAGKYTEDKRKQLGFLWAKHVEKNSLASRTLQRT